MAETYDPRRAAVLLVDPCNDFLSEGGKVWPLVEHVAKEVGLLDNLRAVVASARQSAVRVVFVPHRRWEPGDYETWAYPNPTQRNIMVRHSFARGTWGGEFHPDFQPQPGEVIIKEHWHRAGSPTPTWTSSSRHAGARSHRRLPARDDACRPRAERPHPRPCHPHHEGARHRVPSPPGVIRELAPCRFTLLPHGPDARRRVLAWARYMMRGRGRGRQIGSERLIMPDVPR